MDWTLEEELDLEEGLELGGVGGGVGGVWRRGRFSGRPEKVGGA